jgi:hypothetical protein
MHWDGLLDNQFLHPIRERFADTIVQRLQRIAWWDWPFDLIMRRLADFQSSDIEAFCARWEERTTA